MNKQEWIRRALEKGMDGFEIYQGVSSSRSMTWFGGKKQAFTVSRIISTSVKALVNGKSTAMSLEQVDDEKMDEILDQLIAQASIISDAEKDILTERLETEETPSLKTWTRPSVEEIAGLLSSLEQKLKAADPRITQVNEVEWADGETSREVVNSRAVEAKDSSANQIVAASITMVQDGVVRDGTRIDLVENVADFNQDAFVAKLVEEVSSSLGAKSMKSRTIPVILRNDVMSTLLGCFTGLFYGDMIARGVSPLTGKEGQQIMSDNITIIDDARNQDALELNNYDDEGHPTYAKAVVEKGVFETVLHNNKSALKMNAESTGNGFRSGGGATDVSATNFYIVPGKEDLAELEETMQDGIVITGLAGMHAGIDFVTTNFSLQARGYLVKNGKKDRPVTLITIAGNFLDLMNHVKAVGSDLDWSYRSVAAPSVLFDGIAVSGKE